jgi:hypothetical protein
MMLADDPGVRKGERQRALDPNQDRKHHDDPRRTFASGRLHIVNPGRLRNRQNFDEFVAVLQTLSLS